MILDADVIHARAARLSAQDVDGFLERLGGDSETAGAGFGPWRDGGNFEDWQQGIGNTRSPMVRPW
jgi:hypothetical protein